MAKNNIGITSTTIGKFELRINQKLHGIEIKGEATTQQDAFIKEGLGFYYSKRKGHYYTEFKQEKYDKTKDYLTTLAETEAKSKNKGKRKKAETVAEAMPIDMKKAFPDKAEEKPKAKKAEPKAEPAKVKTINLSEVKTAPKGDDLEEWKRLVILAVEQIIDSAIEALAKEVA